MPLFNGLINSKLPSVGTTIFSVMSRLAIDNRAINLAQGFPDFPCSEELIQLVNKYMRGGHNQYAPMQGVLPLRERIAEMIEELYGTAYHPETEINITAGATQAIYTAISALVRESDEVIIFEPAYDCYAPAIEMAGGKPIYFQLKFPEYAIDWSAVRKVITHRTRMIIINSPHNPTGTVLSANDIKELEKLTNKTDIIVLSDEVYEHMCFDGQPHQSVARSKQLRDRSFMISSFGKTVHTTGWKIAYIAGPSNLMAEFRKVHQYLVFSCNTPVQLALADFLKNKDNYLHLKTFYQDKRDKFRKYLQNSSFSFLPCSGTYFQLLKYEPISREKDVEFAVRLTQEFGLASIPLSVFYHKPVDHKVLRFCFAKRDETLEQAAEILCKLSPEYAKT